MDVCVWVCSGVLYVDSDVDLNYYDYLLRIRSHPQFHMHTYTLASVLTVCLAICFTRNDGKMWACKVLAVK